MSGPEWTEVSGRETFARLLALLAETERPPVVVTTVPFGEEHAGIDVDALANELAGVGELFWLAAHATFWLTDALGDKRLSVHSGWSRVYPPGQEWRERSWLAPIFRPDPEGRHGMLERIVGAVLASSFRPGAFEALPVPAGGEPGHATVKAVMSPTQVLVDVEGRQALMRTQHLCRGVPAERLVRPGQQFDGSWKTVGIMGEFFPDPPDRHAAERARDFVGDGIVTCVFVEAVSSEAIRLLLHPDIALTLVPDGNDLTLLATAGEVVVAEVVYVDDRFVASFSDAPPAPAMAVLPGGPPWLQPVPVAKERRAAGPAAEERKGETSLGGQPEGGAGGAQTMPFASQGELAALEEEVARAQQALDEARAKVRELQAELRRRRRPSLPRVFRDPERQLRFELDTSYLVHVDEPDRARYPWPKRYVIGPGFVPSVERLVADGGITREKVLEVCVDVLCGRAKDRPARAVKEWRTSRHGPPLVRRYDGASAMRARLQNSSPAARRLKYWCLPSGHVELDSVGVHDDDLADK